MFDFVIEIAATGEHVAANFSKYEYNNNNNNNNWLSTATSSAGGNSI